MVNIHDYLSLSNAAQTVTAPYTNPADFRKLYQEIFSSEKKAFLSHFLVNNTPHVFKSCPLLSEQLTRYIADKLEINSSDVRLIGSAKLGFSLNPSKYGEGFNHKSDLDFAIINEDIFLTIKDEFLSWKHQYESGAVKPANEKEKIYWNQNKEDLPANLSAGFIDTNKIPNLHLAPLTGKINNSLYLVWVNLRRINKIAVKKTSARIYISWPAFLKRLKLNAEHIFEKINS